MTSGLKKVQASLRDLSERTKEDMADERGTVSLGGSEEREEIIKSYVKCSTSEVLFFIALPFSNRHVCRHRSTEISGIFWGEQILDELNYWDLGLKYWDLGKRVKHLNPVCSGV